jgi:phage-related protein
VVASTQSGSPDRIPQFGIYTENNIDPSGLTYAGTVNSGIFVWGAQAEVVSNPTLTPTTYQAVGATAGNPTADPNAKFPDDVYTIDRMAEEIPGQVTYELAPAWDVEGVQLPRRQVVANICPWVYKADPCNWTVNGAATVNTPGGTAAAAGTYTAVSVSGGTGTGAKLNVVTTGAGTYSTVATITVANPGTGYTAGNTLTVLGAALGGTNGTNNLTVNIDTLTGAKFFDQNDSEVATSAEDRCGKRLTSCKLRFGTRALPFGGFPSAGLYGKPI